MSAEAQVLGGWLQHGQEPPPSPAFQQPPLVPLLPLTVIKPLATSPRTPAAIPAPPAAPSLGTAASLGNVEHRMSSNLLIHPPDSWHLPAASPWHTLNPGRDMYLPGMSSS